MKTIRFHAWAALALLATACGGKIADTPAPDPLATDRDTQALLTGPSWPQWGQDQSHTGYLGVTGQALKTTFLNYTYDPLVADELAYNDGDLLAHYMTPLTEKDAVYMEEKSGTYTPYAYSTQTWGVSKFKWVNGALVKQWTTWTDWKAIGAQGDFWEPVFHGALANGYLYVPGANGTILKLNKSDGSIAARIDAIGKLGANANAYTVSPLTTDAAGNLYFNVVAITNGADSITRSDDESFKSHRHAASWHSPRSSAFYAKDAVDSWLVKVGANDASQKASYSTLVPGAPDPKSDCQTAFGASQMPWPPSPDAVAPTDTCGTTRAAVSSAPAVAADGTIYTIARTHFISRYGWLVAVNSNLTPKWASSLRDRFHDGCGVPRSAGGQLPPNGAEGGCRVGANLGVDPATNRPGGGRVLDDASSSPSIAPDGSIYYGAYSSYNYYQGHLMHFSAAGAYLNAYEFGWDTTPAFYAHNGTFSVITKDNHYGGDSAFMSTKDRNEVMPEYPEQYRITQLSPNLTVEWAYIADNRFTCHRDASGNVSCTDDPALSMEGKAHPVGFEWCVNAPAVDNKGTVFVNSEDGWLYAINQGGTLRDKLFQQNTIGAAYTPASLGTDGKIYSQNSGHLFVIGK